MANRNEQRTTEIIINGQKANASVKELGASVAVLNNQWKNLKQGTQEFIDKTKELKAAKDRLNEVTSSVKNTKSAFDNIQGLLPSLAIGAIIAKVTEFGSESVKAFRESELMAKRLEFSVRKVAGEGDSAFTLLINQAKELQELSVFSDEQIVQSQKMLLDMGLTTQQVEKLIPKIVDLASKDGDLAGATEKVMKGIEGQTKGLKEVGINFIDTGSKTENLAILNEKLAKFAGQAAEALDTQTGSAERDNNRLNDLQETIGSKLSPVLTAMRKTLLGLTNDFIDLFSPSAFTAESQLKRALDNIGFSTQEVAVILKTGYRDAANGSREDIERQASAILNLNNILQGHKKFLADTGDIEKYRTAIQELNNQLLHQEVTTEMGRAKFNLLKQTIADLSASYKTLETPIKKQGELLVDLTKMTTNELNKRLEAIQRSDEQFKDLDKKGLEDAVKNIEAELKAREVATKKAEDLAKKNKAIILDLEKSKNSALAEVMEEGLRKNLMMEKARFDNEILRLNAIIPLSKEATKAKDAAIEAETAKHFQKIDDLNKEQVEKDRKVAEDYLKFYKDIIAKQKQALIDEKKLEVEITKEGSQERVKAELDLLNSQLALELENVELSENAKKLIKEKYRQLEAAVENKGAKARLDKGLEYYSLIKQGADDFFNFKNQQDDAAINKIQQDTEVRTQTLDSEYQRALKLNQSQLDNKTISQKQFDAKKLALENDHQNKIDKLKAEADNKEKQIRREQFNRNKAAAIIEGIINTAVAVIKAAPNIPLEILTAATGFAEVGIIAAQAVPFAQGGNTFKKGGPVDRPFVAIAGEAGPEWIAPNWMLRNPATANVIGMLENIRVNKTPVPFADGGSTSGRNIPANNNTGKGSEEALMVAINNLTLTTANLNSILSNPIFALFDWDYFQKAKARIEDIQNNSAIK